MEELKRRMLWLKVQKMGAGYRNLPSQELCNFDNTQTLCSMSECVIAERLEMLNVLMCNESEKPTPGSSAIILLAVLISVSCLTFYFQGILP